MKVSAFNQQQFDDVKDECDLIMKGGITSGAVYPHAITELATRYRFVNVGGTSAGAAAAGMAAAAEHNRTGGGFIALSEVPLDIGQGLQSFFQPAPRYRSLFHTFLSALGEGSAAGKIPRVLGAGLRNHLLFALAGSIPALLLIGHLYFHGWSWLMALPALVLLIVGPVLAVAAAILWKFFKSLPEDHFGLCPGLKQPGCDKPALTDWLAEKIEVIAGRMEPAGQPPDSPLTFGDLKDGDRKINLQVMTTNLSMRRPYQLPQELPGFYFRANEFSQLFPAWIVAYLKRICKPDERDSEFRAFPSPDALPVIVAVRMSLSFPALLGAVPLYTQDLSYQPGSSAREQLRRCWFSDGGIGSNFPIHLFDVLWPRRPTFAISLDEHHIDRHGDPNVADNRVNIAVNPEEGADLPVTEIRTLPEFATSIVYSATDWKDIMQSTLAGYRERIAHIALTSDEGGLNLTMPPERVEQLTRYGFIAGERMLTFDFDDHRWRRYLVAVARLEETLHQLKRRYDSGFDNFLSEYPLQAETYKPTPRWLEEALANTRSLMDYAGQTLSDPLRLRGDIPTPETELRVTPEI